MLNLDETRATYQLVAVIVGALFPFVVRKIDKLRTEARLHRYESEDEILQEATEVFQSIEEEDELVVADDKTASPELRSAALQRNLLHLQLKFYFNEYKRLKAENYALKDKQYTRRDKSGRFRTKRDSDDNRVDLDKPTVNIDDVSWKSGNIHPTSNPVGDIPTSHTGNASGAEHPTQQVGHTGSGSDGPLHPNSPDQHLHDPSDTSYGE